MVKVILDTNILLSALVFGGIPRKVVNYCINSSNISVYLSKEIWYEIENKFLGSRVMEIAKKSKRDITREHIEKFIGLIIENSICLDVDEKFDICRDPKDNMFLDLTFACKADYLISGDKDLLTLETFKNTKIILPSAFLLVWGK